MPVTVPRVSVTQAADDLKARDALLRQFPEVEMIVGKAGRADTPTDPSPLEMVETVIDLRPQEFGPSGSWTTTMPGGKRRAALEALLARRLIDAGDEAVRESLVETATMKALASTDADLRELVISQYHDFQAELGPSLIARPGGRAGPPLAAAGADPHAGLGRGPGRGGRPVGPTFAARLVEVPAQEDVNQLMQQIAQKLAAGGHVASSPELLALHRSWYAQALENVSQALGTRPADALHADARVRPGRFPRPVAGPQDGARLRPSSTRPPGPSPGTLWTSSARRPRTRGCGPAPRGRRPRSR